MVEEINLDPDPSNRSAEQSEKQSRTIKRRLIKP